MSDTIAAVATGGGVSAVGIVRMSGDTALTVADSVFCTANGVRMKDAECRRMYYGEFIAQGDGSLVLFPYENHTREPSPCVIDLCLCMISKAPNSYTGEDTVEFHCHGSPVVLSEVLRVLFSHGVRQALPGEFTKRAFLNGRMDLTQAEAVIDLIEAETPAAAQNAAGQLSGSVSVKLEPIYNRLIDIIAHFHAVIDYPDEDIDEFKLQNYLSELRDVENELNKLLETHKRGKILRDGIPTAIIGRPNTGKSSLLNALLGYERAIVTDIAGTTRDTIEEKVIIGKILLRLIDTAGLRKTNDIIENAGVERTLAAIEQAGLVLAVLDGSQPLTNDDFDILHSIPPDVPKIAVVNKSDLPAMLDVSELDVFDILYCSISALSGEGLDTLDAEIQKMFPNGRTGGRFMCSTSNGGGRTHEPSPCSTPVLITNARQAEALSRAILCIHDAVEALTAAVTPDAVLTDIEAALGAIGEITGKTMREEMISRIFERFCVGK